MTQAFFSYAARQLFLKDSISCEMTIIKDQTFLFPEQLISVKYSESDSIIANDVKQAIRVPYHIGVRRRPKS